jgi:hypothetical protein
MGKPLVLRGFSRLLAASVATCCVAALVDIVPSTAADLAATPWIHKRGHAAAPGSKPGDRTAAAKNPPLALVLPDPTLLTPIPEPDCAYKNAVSFPPLPDEVRQKLDYEAQCWRQAEGIVRARLTALQDAVRQMIKGTASRDALASANE